MMSNEPSEEVRLTNVFTLKQLLIMPIHAVIEANEFAAVTAVRFIRREGFTRPSKRHAAGERTGLSRGNEDFGELRMVSFTYRYAGTEGRQRKMTVQIPFLSLIPLPLLEVRRASFDFGLRVLDKLTEVQPEESADSTVEPEISPNSKILAQLTSERSTDEEERHQPGMVANMHVRVEIERSDLPAGLLELMNVSQGASEGKPDPEFDVTVRPSQLLFSSNQQKLLEVHVADPHGDPAGETMVSVEVMSNTLPVEDLFHHKIVVKKGAVIGDPSVIRAKALTGSDGNVVLALHSGDRAGNGFVRIKVNDGQETLVYFDVQPAIGES